MQDNKTLMMRKEKIQLRKQDNQSHKFSILYQIMWVDNHTTLSTTPHRGPECIQPWSKNKLPDSNYI